jgi:hypothetical protein
MTSGTDRDPARKTIDDAESTGDATSGDDSEPVDESESVADEDRPPPAGTTENLLVALVVVALGAATTIAAIRLGAGTARAPGPGMWPLLIGLTLLLSGVALAVLVRGTHDAERFTVSALPILGGLASVVAFVALVGSIGFEIPAAALCFGWLKFLGHEGWRMSLVTSLLVVVAFYALFVGALEVPIPHLF